MNDRFPELFDQIRKRAKFVKAPAAISESLVGKWQGCCLEPARRRRTSMGWARRNLL